MAKNDIKRYLDNWQGEVDGAAQYRALAKAEKNPQLSQVYTNLALMEEKHRGFWEDHLKREGVPVRKPVPSWRTRILIWITEKFGPEMVLSTIADYERVDKNMYVEQKETDGTTMTADEHLHDRLLDEILTVDKKGASGSYLAEIEGRHTAKPRHSPGRPASGEHHRHFGPSSRVAGGLVLKTGAPMMAETFPRQTYSFRPRLRKLVLVVSQ